jgi:hypothetical protein
MKTRHVFGAIAAAVGGYFAGKMLKSDLEQVLEASQRLEGILTDNWGATGNGLMEKVTNLSGHSINRRGIRSGHHSSGGPLHQVEVKRIQTLADMRNKAVHEGVEQIDMNVFGDVYEAIKDAFRVNHGIQV